MTPGERAERPESIQHVRRCAARYRCGLGRPEPPRAMPARRALRTAVDPGSTRAAHRTRGSPRPITEGARSPARRPAHVRAARAGAAFETRADGCCAWRVGCADGLADRVGRGSAVMAGVDVLRRASCRSTASRDHPGPRRGRSGGAPAETARRLDGAFRRQVHAGTTQDGIAATIGRTVQTWSLSLKSAWNAGTGDQFTPSSFRCFCSHSPLAIASTAARSARSPRSFIALTFGAGSVTAEESCASDSPWSRAHTRPRFARSRTRARHPRAVAVRIKAARAGRPVRCA